MHTTRLVKLQEKIDTQREALSDDAKRIATLTEQIELLEKERREGNDERRKLQGQIDQLSSSANASSEAGRIAKKRLDEVAAKLAAERALGKAQAMEIKTLRAKVDEIIAEKDAMVETIRKGKSDLDTANGRYEESIFVRKSQEKVIAEKEKQLMDLQEKERKLAVMNEMMKRVKAQLIEQKAMLTTTKANTHALKDRIDVLTKELDEKKVEAKTVSRRPQIIARA